MVATLDIKEHMEIIGADGVKFGVVDKVVGTRIKLTRDDGHGGKTDHHHFLPINLAADIEGGKLRLSATAANAMAFREEENGTVVTGEPMSTAKDSAFAFGGDAGATPSTTNTTATPPAKSPSKAKNAIGIGAAALGVAAIGAAAFGASKLVRKNEDALPLDNDETMRLISSAKVEGTKVVDRDGTAVGTIQSMMIDKYTGRVAYAILSFGGTFGLGGTLFPLPWGSLDYDVEADAYMLALTKDQLNNAPKFEARDTPEFDAPYRQRIVLFYRGM